MDVKWNNAFKAPSQMLGTCGHSIIIAPYITTANLDFPPKKRTLNYKPNCKINASKWEKSKTRQEISTPVSSAESAWTPLHRVLRYISQECDSESSPRLSFHPGEASRFRYYLGVALWEKWGAKAMLPCFSQSVSDSSRFSDTETPDPLCDCDSLDATWTLTSL